MDSILPKTRVSLEPATWGADRNSKYPDLQKRLDFCCKLVEAVSKGFPGYDFEMLKSRLSNEFVSIRFDFHLDEKQFDKNMKIEHKNIDNLSKIPIDAIYENIVKDLKKDWLVNEIVAKKHPTIGSG